MHRVRIRLATLRDCRALAEMRYQFRTETDLATETKLRFVRRCTSWMNKHFGAGSDAWRCWVLHDGQRLVGNVCAQLFEKIPNPVNEPEAHAYVTNLYVVPEMRGQGLGKKLLNKALIWCRARGVDAVILWPSTASKSLYRRVGFIEPADVLELRDVRLESVMSRNRTKRAISSFLVGAFLFLSLPLCSSAATLDAVKKLGIICFVPSHLPKGFRLKTVEITYDEVSPDENKEQRFPLYSVKYGNAGKATFSIESAREGIGNRNIMEEENAEETEVKTPLGAMCLIYRPQGKDGHKDEIKANWVEDNNMKAEKARNPQRHPTLGRFHGFSATGITLTEFQKIVDSLHPINSKPGPTPAAAGKTSALKIHPKVFNMIDCRVSDSESPVVTEINLDAVEKNENQFNTDDVKEDDGWTRSTALENKEGFMRYRVIESQGNHYKVEYQENGGGTLTTASIIEFEIEKRSIERYGKPDTIRVLRVSSYNQK